MHPLLETINYTVRFLEDIEKFVENPTRDALILAKQATLKHEEIKELTAKKEKIISDLHKQILQLQSHKETTVIAQSTQNCMVGILGELIRCLEGDDFFFNEMNFILIYSAFFYNFHYLLFQFLLIHLLFYLIYKLYKKQLIILFKKIFK